MFNHVVIKIIIKSYDYKSMYETSALTVSIKAKYLLNHLEIAIQKPFYKFPKYNHTIVVVSLKSVWSPSRG